MLCKKCGAQVGASRFCTSCGAPLEEEIVEAVAPEAETVETCTPEATQIPGKGMATASLVLGLVGLILSVICCIFVTFCGKFIALLYIKPEEVEILSNIVHYLRVCGLFYPALCLIFVFRNAIQGMGYGVPAMTAGIFELFARAIMALCFVRTIGFDAAILANTLAWVAADIFLIPMYFYVIHRVKNRSPLQNR